MKGPTAAIVVALLLTLSVPVVAGAAVPSLSSEMTLKPMDKPGAYVATLEVRDANTQELLSAPKIAFRKGEPASTTSKTPSGDEVLVTVDVNESGSSATYSIELRTGGKTVSLQKSTITLAH